MFVELHIIQNFAPSNLNRDDTGSPKDCVFGGYRRARISSQCIKRSIRRDGGFSEFLNGRGGVRTRRLITEIAERVDGQRPAHDTTVKTVSEVFKEGGIERGPVKKGQEAEKDTTRLILFMDESAIEEMARRFRDQWSLVQSRDKAARDSLKVELGEILAAGVRAPDVALFGRMIEIDANKPFGKLQLRVDAASQVAHALSTHEVSKAEFDYFTAVDDIPGPDSGAGFLSTAEFNSACFYRYANLDLEQLKRNLGDDGPAESVARSTVEAFLRAAIEAIPSGKQNSMAAHNPPSLVFAVVRNRGLWSLANAFSIPVYTGRDGDLVGKSITALDQHWANLRGMYGDRGIVGAWACGLTGEGLTPPLPVKCESVDEVIAGVLGTIGFASSGTERAR